jgi:hypothetical protein
MTPCEVTIERLALGEPLGEAEAHVATCPACSRLVALPRLVAASAHAAEPRPGFAIRSAVGARSKLAARRRNRIGGTIVAAAAAVAIGVVAFRAPTAPFHNTVGMRTAPAPLAPVQANDERLGEISLTDEQIGAELIRIADFDRAVAPSRHWRAAQAPVSGYRLIVQQGAIR